MEFPTGQRANVVYRVGANTEMKKVIEKVHGIFSVITKSHPQQYECILLNDLPRWLSNLAFPRLESSSTMLAPQAPWCAVLSTAVKSTKVLAIFPLPGAVGLRSGLALLPTGNSSASRPSIIDA